MGSLIILALISGPVRRGDYLTPKLWYTFSFK